MGMTDEKKIIFSMMGVSKTIPPQRKIIKDIYLSFFYGAKIGVIGLNGSGKSTLLKIIAGLDPNYEGKVIWSKEHSIGYLPQEPQLDDSKTVKEVVQEGVQEVMDLLKEYEEVNMKFAEPMSDEEMDKLMTRQGELTELIEHHGGWEIDQKLERAMVALRCPEPDAEVKFLSGGERRRVALCRLLLQEPDILLLDEPTNHLDIDTIEWLEGYVKRYPKAVVLVSHDRMFLDDVVDVVYEIEYGVMRRYPGNYSNYVNVKKSDLEQQKSAYIRQQKEIQRMEELIEKFRYKKNKAAFAQSKIKYLDRMERIEDPKSNEKSFNARFVPNVKGGKRVLEVQDLTIGYDQPLCTVNLEVMQSAKIAVIGPNGKGKSTFMKTLMKQVEPLSGSFLLGHQIEVGYFDQELAQFNSANTVLEEVWNDFPDLNRTEVRTALGCFLFTGEEVFKTVDCLSGGEKVRLSFVKLMLSHPNFLLMDEPTNHLDLIGKEALEESLKDYEGTMLFVSHDRYFISKLATAILVIGDGKASYYPLTYEEYMNRDKAQPVEKKQQPEKKESAKPERYINYGKEISKLEKKIAVKEEELEALRELRFEPEYYHDYHKMQELDEKIDLIHNEIENLMQKWEEYSEKVEN